MQVQAITTSSNNSSLGHDNHSVNKVRLRRARLAGRRRRGAERVTALSDDEVERGMGSDGSDSGLSSLNNDSYSVSESEAESEDDAHLNGRVRVETPDTNHSPPSAEITTINDSALITEGSNVPGISLLSSNTDWSDMVTNAALNEDSCLPVIDFTDMHHDVVSPSLPRSNSPVVLIKSAKTSQFENITTRSEDTLNGHSASLPSPQRSRSFNSVPRRVSTQTAREVYQQRLQSDPSFVPVVGEFWEHDDRLLQKDFRSLSGWWRGRWQGRGRGRGAIQSKGFVGRGRGAFIREQSHRTDGAPVLDSADSDPERPSKQHDVPPVDSTWAHDRYEELRINEDQRRATQQQIPRSWHNSRQSSVNGSFFRRYSISSTRGRSSGHNRGGFSPSPNFRPNTNFAIRTRVNPDRPWFAMKPERAWTKQHDGFLHFDTTSDQRRVHITTVRVRLPGRPGTFVKLVLEMPSILDVEIRSYSPEAYMEHAAVRLPRKFFASSRSTVADMISIDNSSGSAATTEEPLSKEPYTSSASGIVKSEDSKFERIDSLSSAFAETAVLGSSEFSTTAIADGEKGVAVDIVGAFHPETALETSRLSAMGQLSLPQSLYTPQSHPTLQSYVPPYPYVPHVPPGIAFNQQGVAYEIVTGRPVYLHATPPPPISVYNSHPVPHSHGQFVSGHMSHISSDFIAQASSPNLNGFIDFHTGAPLFSPPRQSTRVEIRAPSELSNTDRSKIERQSSNSRSSASAEQYRLQTIYPQTMAFMPNAVHETTEFVFQEGATNSIKPETRPEQRALDSNVVPYSPYHQQSYYYPERYVDHYQCPMYVDMSQANGQYDAYTPDSHLAQSYYTSS